MPEQQNNASKPANYTFKQEKEAPAYAEKQPNLTTGSNIRPNREQTAGD